MSVGTEEMGRTRVFFRMTHGSLFAECVRGSHMLRKMRKDELSGGCISFVVAAVHVLVQNLKNPLGRTSASAADQGCSPFEALLGSNERS